MQKANLKTQESGTDILDEEQGNENECFDVHANAHGTDIRTITIIDHNKVTQISTQQCNGEWVPFKRVVNTVH